MRTRNIAKLILVLGLVPVVAGAAVVSRVTSFSDGSVLFASDLNSEFNNIVNNMNALDNDNIVAGAAISPSKISGSIAGDAISRNGTTGALSVNDDDSTLTIISNVLQVKDSGVSAAKIASSAVTEAKIANGAVTTNKLGVAAVGTTAIADGQVTKPKLASLGQQISSSSGSFTTTSITFVDVTNLSVSITTTGRPVFVGLIGNGSGKSSLAKLHSGLSEPAALVFDRGGTSISNQFFGASGNFSSTTSIDYPCSGFSYVDTPAAGTYTYKAMVRATDSVAAFLVSVTNCRLIAYEL